MATIELCNGTKRELNRNSSLPFFLCMGVKHGQWKTEERWCFRRILKIGGTEKISNWEVLCRISEGRYIYIQKTLTRRMDRKIGHILMHQEIGNCGGQNL